MADYQENNGSVTLLAQGVVASLNDIGDVAVASAVANDYLQWNGSSWVPGTGAGGASQLNELTDVNTSTPTNRNVLVADGVDFESRALVEADISNLQAYVVSSGVTYELLDSNGDVGTGAGQLAIGNHLHTGVYEPADGTILKDADIGVNVEAFFTKNTGFNLVLGTGSGQVAEGDHLHTGVYEPANANIQSHISDNTIHFTAASLNLDAKADLVGSPGQVDASQISELSVTQHEAALSITESQISDLQSYILAAGVTYENLDANGDVGTSAGTVAIGDHTHALADLTDIDFTGSPESPINGDILQYDGAFWQALPHTDLTGISEVKDDLTPQLGGDLDVNGKDIVSVSNGDIAVVPNGTGRTDITNLEAPIPLNTPSLGSPATYTTVLDDADKMIVLDSGGASTVTIDDSVAYGVGTKLNFLQLGAGQVTITSTGSPLPLNYDSTLTNNLNAQYAVATAIKVATNNWVLFGNLELV